MIGYTLNGRRILFFKITIDLYLVYHDDKVYFTYNKPITDQELEKIRQELAYTLEEIRILNDMLQN